MQMVKCGDYFQADDVPRDFGNICLETKSVKTTESSLVLRHLEVNYKEVQMYIILISDSNLTSGVLNMEH